MRQLESILHKVDRESAKEDRFSKLIKTMLTSM
jgi:hypothetical protein